MTDADRIHSGLVADLAEMLPGLPTETLQDLHAIARKAAPPRRRQVPTAGVLAAQDAARRASAVRRLLECSRAAGHVWTGRDDM